MVLFLKTLLCGMVAVGLTVSVAAQAGSNLRFPLVPVQLAEVAPPASLEDELHAMSAQAGVIFAGEVLAVRPQGDAGTGWVDVEFRVAEAIRGCVGQGTYQLREWAGLWTGGVQRYRVGERLLILLHAPSGMGLSSPVGGQDGAIPITGSGVSPGPKDDFVGVGEQAVDLRWLQARVSRTASSSHESGLHARLTAPVEPTYVGRNAALMTRGRTRTQAPQAQEALAGPVELVQGSTLRVVLALLGAWEAQSADAVR